MALPMRSTADHTHGQSAGSLLISLCQNTVPSLMSAVKFTQSNSIVFTYLQVKYQFPSHEVHTAEVCCVVCPLTNNNHTDHVMLSQKRCTGWTTKSYVWPLVIYHPRL